jgi:hypothetical protein
MKRFLVFLSGLMVAYPALAGEALKSVPSELDPALAYVLVDIINDPPSTVVVPIVLARYDRDRQDIRGMGRAAANPINKGEDLRVASNPRRSLRPKGNGGLSLMALTPGTWTIEGVAGTANSLGSYSFDAPAGKIVDIGVLRVRTTDYAGKLVEPLGTGRLLKIMLMGQIMKTPVLNRKTTLEARKPDEQPLPIEFNELPLEAGVLIPGARFGNYLGGLVDRITAPSQPPATQ